MTNLKIVGIYLAAGQSSRFSGDKLAQLVHGQPLGSIALKVALQSNLSHTIVITKEQDVPWLQPLLKNQTCTQVVCHKAFLGQAESIKCGIRYAQHLEADAALIMLADQPFITAILINQLIKKYQMNQNSLFIASKYQAEIYPPILLSRQMFPFLSYLTGDHGAKKLLIKHANKGKFITFSNQQYFIDFDTLADFLQLQKNEFP